MTQRILPLLLLVLCLGCVDLPENDSNMPTAPVAKTLPEELEAHGEIRVDPYYWLRERENPEVISYLEAENAYTEAVMAHTTDLQETLFVEMRGRIKEDDASVPVRRGGYWYYTRFEEGGEYALYGRRKGSLDGPEELLLDGNAFAEGEDYFAVRGLSVSSGENILAFATDTVGRRIYTIRFKDLDSGEILDDEIAGTNGNLAWAEDNRTLFYTRRDPQTLRSFQIFRHQLGDVGADVLVYEEEDETFSTAVWKTKSKRFMIISSSHTLADEARFLDAKQPTGEFEILLPRERGHEYRIAHRGDHFFLRTNRDAQNFRLVKTPSCL